MEIMIVSILSFLGCQPGKTEGSPPTEEGIPQDTETPSDPPVEIDNMQLTGEITWTLDFDSEAEGNGYTDCSYKREYTGGEDWSANWLCDDCDKILLLDVVLSDGLEDCYQQIASTPAPQERLGWNEEGRFFRGSAPAYSLSDQGEISWNGNLFTTYNQVENELEGGSFIFDINGSFEVTEGSGDPMHGWTPPESYACGWPKADPPVFEGSYILEVGGTLPDGYFGDQCGEAVRLHDFKGRYIVIDISAVDCPPCQSMAAAEPDFAAAMEDAGLEVSVLTLLAPSLGAVIDPTPQETLQEWADTYDLHDPVLGDRGWGYWLGNASLGDDFGYPTWLVVTPDLEILEIGNGFSSWDNIASLIQTDAGQ